MTSKSRKIIQHKILGSFDESKLEIESIQLIKIAVYPTK